MKTAPWSSGPTEVSKVKVYQIEATNVCNLSCSFCPRFASWYKRPLGFMDPDLLDRVDWLYTAFTEVQFTGEPTLHAQLPEILKRIKKYGVKVGFSTNGTVLDRLEECLNIADVVTVNDDKYRDPVFEHHPKVRVQKLGKNYPVEDYSRKRVSYVPSCRTPFEYVSIHWNGDVVPCCKDHGGQHVFGNLWKQTFQEIVTSKKRERFLNGLDLAEANGLCEFCKNPNPHWIHKRLERSCVQ